MTTHAKGGRPRKAIDKRMVTTCHTLMPSHVKWLEDKAAELSRQLGHEVSESGVMRALIRHAADSPPKEWKTE